MTSEMASKLVPGDFSLLKLMRVFADFQEDHKRGLELVRQIKLRIQALINILIFTELFILSLTPFCIQM